MSIIKKQIYEYSQCEVQGFRLICLIYLGLDVKPYFNKIVNDFIFTLIHNL